MILCTTSEVACPLRTSSTWVRMLFAIVLWPCNTSCVIAGLAANRARREEEGGFATGGKGIDGAPRPRGIYVVTWEHIRVYMQECVRLCEGPGSSVTREMDVLASSESLQLVERLRKRRLGSHPVRGEFASVLPWHRAGLWLWRMECV